MVREEWNVVREGMERSKRRNGTCYEKDWNVVREGMERVKRRTGTW